MCNIKVHRLVCYVLTKLYANGVLQWHAVHSVLDVAEQADARETTRKPNLLSELTAASRASLLNLEKREDELELSGALFICCFVATSNILKKEAPTMKMINNVSNRCYTHDMNSPQKIPLLLITGTVGVGKSSVADEIFEILKIQNEPIALINIDEFGYAAPCPMDDPFNTRLQIKNLAATWPNYSEVGVKSLIIPCIVEKKNDIERFRSAIIGADIFVICLDAALSTIESRIKNRPMGGSLEWHLQRAKELKKVLALSDFDTINTDDKTISQVANEVIMLWRNDQLDTSK